MKKEKKENILLQTEKAVVNTIAYPFRAHKLTIGQRASDGIAKWAGSWTFILSFVAFLILWMVLNTTMAIFGVWDEPHFILLNLVLSCIAALQAPVILMSQNRAAQRDRMRAEYDYAVNRKAEKQIEEILKILKKRK